MKHHLNIDKKDPHYALLKEIFKIIDSRKSREIIASKRVTNINMFVLTLKIIFTSIFFGLDVNFVVNELKNSFELRKFFNIREVPETSQVYEYFNRLNTNQCLEIANRILNNNKSFKRRSKMTFIVDATPVDLDFNINRKHRSKKYLKKLNLKWSYSSSKKFYIGFKATVVIEHDSAMPVVILIHSGAPHDSKIFDSILEELQKRRIIRKNDTIIFDKGYYSYQNYQIGINKYKIVPFIFPKDNFKIEKLNQQLSYPLNVFDHKKDKNKLRILYKRLKAELLVLISKWKKYKPIRGKIEDFFKFCKKGLNLQKIHKYTPESVSKTIILTVFLAGIITTLGYNTKTALQKLSET